MRGVALAVVLAVLPAGSAVAQDIFRWVKPDGSVTFTDSLAALPEPVRQDYNRKIAAREAQRAELERSLGKEERARREAEAERTRVANEAMEAAERATRLSAIDERLKAFAEADKKRQNEKKQWIERVRTARAKVQKLYQDFHAAEATWNDLGTRASFTLLPGQAEELAKAKETMDALVPQLDAAIKELEVTIPEEARRAGIPPGWLREA
jgi:chromosome segregation ATPase